jgi:hypothetical protein
MFILAVKKQRRTVYERQVEVGEGGECDSLSHVRGTIGLS